MHEKPGFSKWGFTKQGPSLTSLPIASGFREPDWGLSTDPIVLSRTHLRVYLIWQTLGFPSTRSSNLYTGLERRSYFSKRMKRKCSQLALACCWISQPSRLSGRILQTGQSNAHCTLFWNNFTIRTTLNNLRQQCKHLWSHRKENFALCTTFIMTWWWCPSYCICSTFQKHGDSLNPSNRPWVWTRISLKVVQHPE